MNRRTETPNATMTTLASPSQGGSERLSVWRVEMAVGARGPVHVFDSEQVWTVLAGSVVIEVDGAARPLVPGASIVIEPGVTRQITATTAATMMVCGYGDAIVRVPGEPADRGTPAWIS